MNGFDFDYPPTTRDDAQDAGNGSMQSSLPNNGPTLIDFSNGYDFSSMLSADDELPLQSFDRSGQQQGDLEGRLSNVMLTYDSMPSTGASMPMSMDANSAFAFDGPSSYPATTMGLVTQLDQPQLQPTFPPFTQPLPLANQYMQQQDAPQSHKGTYNNNNNYTAGSTGSYDDSDFSRASDRSQVPMSGPSQRFSQYGQPASSFRSSQPVAIQPKKPVAVKGECRAYKPIGSFPQTDSAYCSEEPSPGLSTPDANSTEHTGIYSSTGFDILGVLVSRCLFVPVSHDRDLNIVCRAEWPCDPIPRSILAQLTCPAPLSCAIFNRRTIRLYMSQKPSRD